MRSAKFSKIVIFSVCILLVFAVAAALLFNNGATLPAKDNVIAETGEGADVASAAYPVSADGYTHGSNVKNNTTAQAVNDASGLISAIQNNTTIRLTGPITLTASDVQKIWNYTYSGTIYGNGQTIKATFPSTGNTASVTTTGGNLLAYGGLCGTLTGAIYDLTFEHTGGQLNVWLKGNNSGFAGGLVGSVVGGTIENVKITLSSTNGGRVGIVKESSGGIFGTNQYVAAGALAGRIHSGIVRNVTIINDAWIESGLASSSSTDIGNKTPGHSGNVAGIIGPVQGESWSGTVTMDNLVVEGSVTSSSVVGDYVANIGTLTTSNIELNVTNFYNKYKNTYDGNADSSTFLKNGVSPSLTISNLYQASGVTSGSRTDCTVSNTITVTATDYTVGFDPKVAASSSSLVVYKNGVTGGEGYSASIRTGNGTTYSNNYAFSSDGGTVIFRNLPSGTSYWSSGGNFACTINITQDAIDVTPLDPVNKWESSHTTSQSTTGTAVDNGSKLTTAINNNNDIYLTGDITDFKGFTHTGTYSGTLDGNGHTIYIVNGANNSTDTVGGLFRILSGTIKNVRIVLYSSYNRTVTSGTRGTGIVAGVINGGTVDNVYVYIPSGVTFGVTGSQEGYVGAIAGLSAISTDEKVDGTNYTIKNTTVHIDGKMHLDGSYVYMAGFVGKSSTASSAVTVDYINCVFKGSGSFSSSSSKSTEPIYLGATTVMFQKDAGNPKATININGFINAFNGGESNLTGGYSMYGVLSKNDNGKTMSKWTWNVSNVYDYDSPWADINNKGTDSTGNNFIDISSGRSTVSTTVDGSSIKVTPYFPAGDTDNLVLVAGDGTVSVPDVAYNGVNGTADGKYMVVAIAKADITAKSTVELQKKSFVNDPSISTPAENLVYNGGEITVEIGQLTAGSITLTADDYTLKVAAKDGGTGSVQNNKPVNAGEYTLTVTLLNGYEFEDGSTDKILEFAVQKKAVTIDGVTATERPYDGTTDVTLSGGTINGIEAADDGKVSFTLVGALDDANAGDNKNVNVTATLTGEKADNYQLSAQPAVTVNITKASVSVSWSATSAFEYNGSAQAPTATATGVGQESVNIILTIKNAQDEVQAGGAVNAGTYTAEATTDNGNYALTNATKQFEITKKAIIVNVTVEDWTYGENASDPDITGNDGNGDVTYLYVGQTNAGDDYSNEAVPTEAGTYTLTVSVAETQNYQEGEATSAQFTVAKKQLDKPTASATVYVYTGTEQTYTPDGFDDATMNIVGNAQTAANESGYTVTVSLKDTFNYEWTDATADEAEFTFTISKAVLTDNTQDVVGTYNASEYSLTAELDDFVNGEDLASAGGIVKYGTEEGVYDLDSYGITNATSAVTVYYQITFANYGTVTGSRTITVNAKQIAVVWNNMSQSYTGNALKPAASVSEEELEGNDVLEITVRTTKDGEDADAIDVGTYGAVATANNPNYELTNATVGNFEITAADFETAVQIGDWIYDQPASQPSVTLNPGSGAVTYKYTGRGETVYAESETAPTNAGTYTVTATIAASGNYAEKVVSADFTIEKAVVAVPVIEDQQYTGDTITSGLEDTDYYTVQDNGGIDVGPYTATLTLIDSNNYAWASGDDDNDGIIEVEYEIVAQDVHINSWTTTPSVIGWTYGGYADKNAPVYQALYGNDKVEIKVRLKSGSDTDYAVVEDLSTLNAGVYFMKFTVAASIDPEGGESYTGLSSVVEFTVAKAQISLGVSIDGWTYGNAAAQPVVSGNTASGAETYSYEGTGDTVYEASEEAPVNAGTYRFTVTVAETDNYLGGSAYCDFTISQKGVTATVSADSATYDGAEHAATVSFDGKLADDELTANLLYNGAAVVPVNAGSYTVTVGSYGGAAVANYDITASEGEAVLLVISPKTLSVDDIVYAPTDENDDGVYDGEAHAITASVSAAALYGEDVVTLRVLYNGSETEPVDAGTYVVSFEVTDNDNYVVEDGAGFELTVAKATVDIAGSNASVTYTGEAFTGEQIISAVFGDQDLSLVNVNVAYGESGKAEQAGDTATLTLALKDADNYEFVQGMTQSYTFTVAKGTVSLAGEDKTAEYKGTAYTENEIKNAVFGEGNWADFDIEISYNNVEALNAGDIATVTVTGYSDDNYALDPETETVYQFAVTTFKVGAPQLAEVSFVYNGAEQSVSLVDDTYVVLSANVQTDKGDYNAVAALKDKANYEWTSGGNADVALPWSITAKEITLKAETSVDKAYDGEAYDFAGYVVTGADAFYERDNVTVEVSAGSVYTPGEYLLEVSHNAGDNYDVTVEQTDAVLTVETAVLTITAQADEKEFTGNDLTFEFEISGGKVDGDDVSIGSVVYYDKDGAAATPNAIGTYVAKFTLAGAQAGYYTVGDVTVTVKAPTTDAPDGMTSDSIIVPQGEIVYDGNAHPATLDYQKDETDENTYGLVYYFNGNPVDEPVKAGTYVVRVFKNSSTFEIYGVEQQFTIIPATLTFDDITVGGTEFTYSGGTNKVTAKGTGVKGETVNLVTLYDGNEAAPVNAGSYTLTLRSSNSDYTVAADVAYTMMVYRKNVNVPVAKELVYNGTEQVAFDQNAIYEISGVYAATHVSEQEYTATFTLTDNNYKWSDKDDVIREISVNWNISPKETVIGESGAAKTSVYDGEALTQEELAVLFTAPEGFDGDVALEITVIQGEIRNAGSYTVVASVADADYTAEDVEITYTVTQAKPVVIPVVDDVILQEGYLLGNVGISLGDGSTAGTISWDLPETALVKGDNTVSWTFVPEDTLNYTTDNGSETLVVGDDVLDSLVLVSGPFKTQYTAFEEFDPEGIELKAVFNGGLKEQPVGTDKCTIVIENGIDGKMSAATTKVTVYYGEKFVEITGIVVAKIQVAIPTLSVNSLEYNAQEQTLPLEVQDSDPYAIRSGNKATEVGAYSAEISLKDAVNYAWESGSSANVFLGWNITPVTLTVKVVLPEAEELVYDGKAKTATFELTGGTLYGNAQITLSYRQNGATLKNAPVDAGEYLVVANLPDSRNYRYSAEAVYSATMTVSKKVLTITTIGSREKVYDGKEVTVSELAEHFIATDGITVNVSVSGTVLDAGTYEIVASVNDKNYTAESVRCTYTVRKATRSISAKLDVKYLGVAISDGETGIQIEYSEDGNVWQVYEGTIAVDIKAVYEYYVRYAGDKNYNASEAVKLQANVTKDALNAYAAERFTEEITLADVADIAWLETLAQSAQGENEIFDQTLAELSAQRAALTEGAEAAVEKALKAGGALKGYAAVTVALALGGAGLAVAAGLLIMTRKGGKKDEEK